MSYFRTEAEALHLAVSEDGLKWQALNGNKPILTGEVGTQSLRDPFIFSDQNGIFHLFATNGWRADSIVHATSPDLIQWSAQQLVPVMDGVLGVRNCWAPECFYEHEVNLYRVIWSSSIVEPSGRDDWNHRIWSTATQDFKTYTSPELFFDPGYSVIDATVAWYDGSYVMAFKDERGENRIGTERKAICVCRANGGNGPGTEISEFVTPPLTEGPTLFRAQDRWIMLFDHFIEDFFGAIESEDGAHWHSISEQVQIDFGPRHASVFEVNEEMSRHVVDFYS